MTVDADVATLARDVRYLMDRTLILDCISRHARGCDRHDNDLITAAYRSDGVDEHGYAINPGPEYGAWANETHAETSRVHTHNITTHTCEIDGDTAHTESYVHWFLRLKGSDKVRAGGGRGSGVPDSIAELLSARELEVLLLLDEHLATDEIAKRLFISEHTVRSHVKSLLRKLGVSSRREALEALATARR